MSGGHRDHYYGSDVGLIAIPHDIPDPGDSELWRYLRLATHSPITFGIHNRLSPRALLARLYPAQTSSAQ